MHQSTIVKPAGAVLLFVTLANPIQAATTVTATVIYDNQVTAAGVNNGRTNDPDFPLFIQHADDFALPAQSLINGVEWHGIYRGNNVRPDNFSLKIYQLSSGVPTLSPLLDIPLGAVTSQDTGRRISYDLAVYAYTATFPGQTLAAGSYGLSIYHSASDGVEWLWATAQNANGSFMILGNETQWTKYTGAPEFSFALTYIPEPSAAALLALVVPPALLRRGRPRRRVSPPGGAGESNHGADQTTLAGDQGVGCRRSALAMQSARSSSGSC